MATETATTAAGTGAGGAGEGTVTDVGSQEQFLAAVSAAGSKLVVVVFWAEFHEPSKRGGQVDVAVNHLAALHKDVTFLKVNAESIPKLSLQYAVSVVPTFVFLRAGKQVGKQEGAHIPALATNVETLKQQAATSTTTGAGPGAGVTAATVSDELRAKLAKLVSTSRIMLFMKGTPQEPKCPYSETVANTFTASGIKYSAFDVTADNDVREGLKTVYDFRTFPQVFVNGKKFGDHAVIATLAASDPKLASLAGPAESGAAATADEPLEQKLVRLINQAPVVLFMKGTAETPRCGFSRKAVALLQSHKIEFATFDILGDQEVRQGLKKFSNWPTYPQLYAKGKLVGGLDILKELEEEDALEEELGLNKPEDLNKRLKRLTTQSRAVLFMKGVPTAPRCGFSRKTVALLDSIGLKYTFFDILTDNDVRQGLKTFSNWPTYPQLYVDGKLIGGLDILKEMAEEGELQELAK